MSSIATAIRPCVVRNLGRMDWAEAFALQQELVAKRKRGEIPDQLIFVEHPHVVTMGRSAHSLNPPQPLPLPFRTLPKPPTAARAAYQVKRSRVKTNLKNPNAPHVR